MLTTVAIPLLLLTLVNLQEPPESSPAEVELDGTLVLTPVMSRTTDSPDFQVHFTSHSPTFVEAPVLQVRSGIILDGREYVMNVYRWAGIIPKIEPGSSYDFKISLGGFLPGAERKGFSRVLGQWRWMIPLASGPHRVRYFLRKTLPPNSPHIESNEVVFIWDDSRPLLYELPAEE